MSEWIAFVSFGLSLVAAGIAIGTRTQIIEQLKAAIEKMNGLPQKVATMEKEITYNEDWRHDVAVPYFNKVNTLEIRLEHLNEKLDLKRDLDEIKRKLG